DVLAANGVKLEDLSADERAQVLDALSHLAGKSSAKKVNQTNAASGSPPTNSANANGESSANNKQKNPRTTRNQKEVVIEIAALKGKGYPEPVSLDTGSPKAKRVT